MSLRPSIAAELANLDDLLSGLGPERVDTGSVSLVRRPTNAASPRGGPQAVPPPAPLDVEEIEIVDDQFGSLTCDPVIVELSAPRPAPPVSTSFRPLLPAFGGDGSGSANLSMKSERSGAIGELDSLLGDMDASRRQQPSASASASATEQIVLTVGGTGIQVDEPVIIEDSSQGRVATVFANPNELDALLLSLKADDSPPPAPVSAASQAVAASLAGAGADTGDSRSQTPMLATRSAAATMDERSFQNLLANLGSSLGVLSAASTPAAAPTANSDASSTTSLLRAGPAGAYECYYCKKAITGEIVTAEGRSYHPEHFHCLDCMTPLGSNPFYSSTRGVHCKSCYERLHQAKCAGCGQKIVGPSLVAMDVSWHSSCFVCSVCRCTFGGGSAVYSHNNRVLCEKHYQEACIDKCLECSKPAVGDVVEACGGVFHSHCFVCGYCREPFTDGVYFEHKDRAYCKPHYYVVMGQVCAGCGRPVSGTCVQAMGKKYHSQCFQCSFCKAPLPGAFSQHNEKPYCRSCVAQLFSS